MNTQTTHQSDAIRRFVLAPNVAPDWGQTLRIFILLSAVCLGIGVVCAWHGLWPVLPFAGIEITALGIALYVSARRSLDREVIAVSAGKICIEKGRGRAEKTWDLERAWTEVILRRLPKRWGQTQLMLRSRGQEVIIGEFLEARERRSLARELSRCIGPMARCGDGTEILNRSSPEANAVVAASLPHRLGDRTG